MEQKETAIRLVIAEDTEMVLRSLEAVLESKGFDVVGAVKNGRELLAAVDETRPDVVLTDVRMPEMDGIAAMRELKRLYPELAVVGLTQYDEEQLVVDMLQAGARGFLFKDESLEELYEAIAAVHEGRMYYCQKVPVRLLRRIARGDSGAFPVSRSSFSAIELDVIRLICEDRSSREMAERLHRSKDAIDKCRQRIMEKLRVHGPAGVVRFAVREGICRVGE